MSSIESPVKSLSISLFNTTEPKPENEQQTILSVIKQACKDKNFAVLKYILQITNTIPEETVDEFGNTILHYAIINFNEIGGLPFIQQLLAMKGIEKIINTISDKDGLTPVVLAFTLRLPQIVDLLIARGADNKTPSRNGTILETDTETSQQAPQEVPQQNKRNETLFPYLTSFLNQITGTTTKIPETTMQSLQSTQTQPVKQTDEENEQQDVRTTEFFRNIIEKQFPQNKTTREVTQEVIQPVAGGGSKSTIVGQRLLHRLEVSSISGGKNNKNKSRRNKIISNGKNELERITNDVHERTIETIKNILNIDYDDAKIYKSALYYRVKEEHPDLSSYQRAVEMEKLATKEILKKINFDAEKKKYDKFISEKKKLSTSSESSSESESPKNTKKSKKNKKESSSESSSESDIIPTKRKSKKQSDITSSSDTTSSPDLDTNLSD